MMTEYNYHNWRQTRYYLEEVDNIIKAFLPAFDSIFQALKAKSTKLNPAT